MSIEVIRPAAFLEELVLLFLLSVKGVGVAVAAFVYGLLFTAYFIAQWFFLGARFLHNQISGWVPSVPPIFQLGE